MSGLAEILFTLGKKVQGSDIAENNNTKRLEKCGIKVLIGHCADNTKDAGIVVLSSAIASSNPEVKAALEAGIPVIKRAELLKEIMRMKWAVSVAGTHGKTTTTSLVASVLDSADLDPTVINGGVLNAYSSNARVGSGDWLVAEADESDGTFIKIPTTVAVVTNIDPEHLSYYGTFDKLKQAFHTFVENIPFYGFAVLCLDNDNVREMIPHIKDRRVITYGFRKGAHIRATNVRVEGLGICFDVAISKSQAELLGVSPAIKNIHLPMVGVHNVSNALASIAVGLGMKLSPESIRNGLSNFKGVCRRFTQTGAYSGANIFDDYAHHPEEIKVALKAAKTIAKGKVIAVKQPHRFSRLQELFGDFCACFEDADLLFMAPIYTAGEKPIPGITRDSLVEGIREINKQTDVQTIDDESELPLAIKKTINPGDVVIFLGAGSVSNWARALPEQLENLPEAYIASVTKAS